MLNKPADDPGPDSPGKADPGVLSWTEELRRVAVAVSKKDRKFGQQSPAALLRSALDTRCTWLRDYRAQGARS